jgi:leucyl aminopeptidase
MKLSVQKGDLTQQKCDLLVVNQFEEQKGVGGATGAVDKALGGLVSDVMKEEHFTGALGSTVLIRPPKGSKMKRVVVVGLGKKKDFGEEAVRQAAAVSLNAAKAMKAKRVCSILHGAGMGGLNPRICGKAIAEGALLASYDFAKYKAKEVAKRPDTFDVVTIDGKAIRPATDGVALGETYARATILSRDLVNEPAQHMRPIDLVNAAREVAKASKGKVKLKVFDKAQLERMGAGGILGVSRGSDHDPFMVHLIYRGTRGTKKIALVGKAITFDTGGISLKPADAMMTMKLDMAGAAAVIGAFSALTALKPNVEVHGIFGACENMPSGKAIVPGDVVRAMNKKTIEVLNTDAEGRVTLADTLTYAVKQKPNVIIDLATLTGAVMVALGEEVAGVMANDPKVAQKVLAAAEQAGENMWELPLEKNYVKLLKSEVADLKNIAGRYGGAITAGLFLAEFVDDVPWAHLDIAGPAFAEKPLNPYTKHGGTGFGVRTLLELVRSF